MAYIPNAERHARQDAEGKTIVQLEAMIASAEKHLAYLNSRREYRVEFDDARERHNASVRVKILKDIMHRR